MKKGVLLLITLFTLSSSLLQAQTVSPVFKANLPPVNDESSGVEVISRNNIWSHNDSGGEPDLYNFDSTGTLLRTLTVSNASNVDWEEVTQDDDGNFYMGDFGNNANDRSNLVIYKIAAPSGISGSSTTAELIQFSYPDQAAFPPVVTDQNFDMEAMFWFNHSLYLFSKNRTNPYDGYTKLYQLPETAGTYTATLLDSFYLGSGPYYLTSATAADISPDGNAVAVMSGAHITLFTGFTGNDFFGGSSQELDFASVTQKEAIVFISNDEVYITDENAGNTGQKLYYLDLGTFLSPSGFLFQDNSLEIETGENPFYTDFTIRIKTAEQKNILLTVSDLSGKIIFQQPKVLVHNAWNSFTINDSLFYAKSGFFYLTISSPEKDIYRNKLLKLSR